MATETQFTVLLIEIGILVLVQVGAIIALMVAVQKSTSKMEAIADDLHRRTVPLLEGANSLLNSTRPQIENIVANLTESSEKLKYQVDDIIDRTRLQVVRADELATRTMDRVEETTELVQHTIVSPVRQIAGVLQGLTMGFNVLFGRRGPNGNGRQHASTRDEMFI
ncbi:MAG TPA: hypothetical protein VMU28_01005 [Terriglobales bacterium]|nr:hypothetical protein [Terriglobales bacterium]